MTTPVNTPTETEQPTEVTLSQEQIAQAATNDPQLAPDEFQLGDRVFKILDLPYDDYVKFLAHLQPFIDVLAAKMGGRQGVKLEGLDLGDGFSIATIVKFCGASLPEMARIVCSQSDPTVTVEDVKKLGRNPFMLASIVLRQLVRNGIIQDFASFFGQVIPLMRRSLA